MGIPEACDVTTAPSALTRRLDVAYRRYDRAYTGARPGTAAAAELARARLDLTLLLLELAEQDVAPLDPAVLAQLERDARSLVDVTQPLP